MNYEKRYEVRWADLDANRHIRNTAYSEYATHTRFAFLAENGYPHERFEELQFGPVIFSETAHYKREVTTGDVLTVKIIVHSLAKTGRYQIEHPIYRSDGLLAATITLDGAFMSLKNRRLCKPPADLALMLKSLMLEHEAKKRD